MTEENILIKIRTAVDDFMDNCPTLCQTAQFKDLESKLNVPKVYLFAGALFVIGLILFVLGGAVLLINIIGFAYPAYASFKALETERKDDDTQWLTYWCVFAFFSLFEQIFGVLVEWIPFYFLGKVVFLIWCYHPMTKGALKLYKSFVRVYLIPLVGIEKNLKSSLSSSSSSKKKSSSKTNNEKKANTSSPDTLVINVRNATGLPINEEENPPSAFCVLEITDLKVPDDSKYRTSIVRSSNPEWNEKIKIGYNDKMGTGSTKLRITVFDTPSIGEDISLGSAEMPITDITPTEEGFVITLVDKNGNSTGGQIEFSAQHE